MRFDARDAGPYSHHLELPLDRPVLGGLHQGPADAMATCLGPHNKPDDFGAFTRLQQQTALSGNPPDDARFLLGYDDEARVCVQEYIEPLSYLIDSRRVLEFSGEARDGRSVVECRGTEAEGGGQNRYRVRDVLTSLRWKFACGFEQVPEVTVDVPEDSNRAVRFRLWLAHELDSRREHGVVVAPEVVGGEEEEHPSAALPADGCLLLVIHRAREQQRRSASAGWCDDHPSLVLRGLVRVFDDRELQLVAEERDRFVIVAYDERNMDDGLVHDGPQGQLAAERRRTKATTVIYVRSPTPTKVASIVLRARPNAHSSVAPPRKYSHAGSRTPPIMIALPMIAIEAGITFDGHVRRTYHATRPNTGIASSQ